MTRICPRSSTGPGSCVAAGLCEARKLCLRLRVAPVDFLAPTPTKQSADCSTKPALHFVGFRFKTSRDRQHYANAVQLWGCPDFEHETYDHRAYADIAVGIDTVVHAVTPPPYPVPRLTPMKGGYTTITVPLASDTNI